MTGWGRAAIGFAGLTVLYTWVLLLTNLLVLGDVVPRGPMTANLVGQLYVGTCVAVVISGILTAHLFGKRLWPVGFVAVFLVAPVIGMAPCGIYLLMCPTEERAQAASNMKLEAGIGSDYLRVMTRKLAWWHLALSMGATGVFLTIV